MPSTCIISGSLDTTGSLFITGTASLVVSAGSLLSELILSVFPFFLHAASDNTSNAVAVNDKILFFFIKITVLMPHPAS